MKTVLNILATLIILSGGVWFLQGINILPGSFMTGQIQWAIYGGDHDCGRWGEFCILQIEIKRTNKSVAMKRTIPHSPFHLRTVSPILILILTSLACGFIGNPVPTSTPATPKTPARLPPPPPHLQKPRHRCRLPLFSPGNLILTNLSSSLGTFHTPRRSSSTR
ncbi:MAG: hypothetical protein HC806_00565 [Anaerolineae bacterium]|nr:hypothetical protein [Anaerolineae bacterium]